MDQYGRQALLSTYVQYQCKIPHPFSGKRRLTSSRSNIEEFAAHRDLHIVHETSVKRSDRKGIK